MNAMTTATNEEFECPICYEAINGNGDIATIPSCNHRFCLECIETSSKRSNSCPMCRLRFEFITTVDGRRAVPLSPQLISTSQQLAQILHRKREERRQREELMRHWKLQFLKVTIQVVFEEIIPFYLFPIISNIYGVIVHPVKKRMNGGQVLNLITFRSQ